MCQEKEVCGRVIIATCKKAKCLNSKYTWSRKKRLENCKEYQKQKRKCVHGPPCKQQATKNNKTKQNLIPQKNNC